MSRKLSVVINTADRDFCDSLGRAAQKCGAAVVDKGPDSLEFLATRGRKVDMLLLDIRESPDAAISYLRKVRRGCPHIEVLLINRPDNIKSSMRAMQAGAMDELIAPIDIEVLREKIEASRARTMGRRKSLIERLSDAMVAATFAQAGEFDAAREFIKDDPSDGKDLHKASEEPDGSTKKTHGPYGGYDG